MHPLDAALNLPEEKHSHGLRRLAALEAARGSMEAAGAAITRATGVMIGKRQLVPELARRCAAHVEAFYLQRAVSPAPDDHALVLTFDGKGIVMLPERCGLPPRRPRPRRRASSPPGCHRGRRTAASGWPSWPASMTPPRPAYPRRHHQHPRAEEEGAGREGQGPGKAAGAAGAGQVADRVGHRRHPRRHRLGVR